MGSLGASDTAGEAGWTAAPDRHVLGDERDLLSSANRLPVALFAAPVFPPRSTVYNIFRAFQREGVWEAIWEELRAALRERLGREASPSAGMIDSQSLKSAEKGDAKQTQWVMTPARVRPEGAYHLWRKIPSGKLSIGLEADERFSRVTGWTEAS